MKLVFSGNQFMNSLLFSIHVSIFPPFVMPSWQVGLIKKVLVITTERDITCKFEGVFTLEVIRGTTYYVMGSVALRMVVVYGWTSYNHISFHT